MVLTDLLLPVAALSSTRGQAFLSDAAPPGASAG
jgi:hypothetical protein